MAELADALASGASGSNVVQVQPLSRAPKLQNLENFRFITIAICKNDFRKTTSHVRLPSLMIEEIEKRFPYFEEGDWLMENKRQQQLEEWLITRHEGCIWYSVDYEND